GVRALADPDWRWLAAAVALGVGSMLLYARMQLVLLRGAGVATRYRKVAALGFAAHSLSITLPGGALFSTALNFRVMSRWGASGAVASWVIAVSGALSATALAVIGVVSGVLLGTRGELRDVAVALLAVAALPLGAWVLRSRPEVGQLAGRLVAALAQRVGRGDPEQAHRRVLLGLQQLGELRVGPLVWLRASGASLVNWVLDAACLAMCIRAVGGEEVPPAGLLLAYTATMAAASFNIVPAGLGVVDATLSVGLAAAGLPAHTAVAATALYRLTTLGVIGGAGWVLWWWQRRRREL
ncbi:YbhN family protein, partial [Kineococcus glutinatus]|uniref:lysylphosphatidylglycerol synthase transmembrane domain-containing protein n=1 Tax=Kineococcus glutinatus TaxID=1070872 RepID=UPI0031EE48E7